MQSSARTTPSRAASIGATALLLANFVVVRLVFHYPRLDKLLGGSPTVLIENGKVVTRALQQELLTMRELRLAANRQGVDDLREVSRGEIEPNGTFSFEKNHTSRADQQRAELSDKVDVLIQRVDQLLQRKQ